MTFLTKIYWQDGLDVQTYMNIFSTNPNLQKSVRTPLEQGNNPELDTSELLDNENT